MQEFTVALVKRFIRTFAAGMISGLLAFLAGTTEVPTDWKTWVFLLCLATMTGGLSAADKALRWKE